MGAVREGRVATADGVQSFGDNFGDIWAGLREIIPLLLSLADPHPDGQVLRTALLVGRTNLPLRVVLDPSFRAFMRGSTLPYQHPSPSEFRDAILKIAEQFRVEYTPVTEQGRFCNLMVDRATSGAKTWLGACVLTPRPFSFWRCASNADQTAATLIERFLQICRNLMRKGFVVCSIVTDNATNEIAAVRDRPKQLDVPVFRVPCLIHSTALALKDFLAQVFPPIAGRDFFGAMIDLRDLLPDQGEDGLFHGIPRPCETRWTSLGHFTQYVACDHDRICAFLGDKSWTRPNHRAAVTLLFEVRFNQRAPCLQLLDTLVDWTQDDEAFLADACSESLAMF
jgi:hypothetical protein